MSAPTEHPNVRLTIEPEPHSPAVAHLVFDRPDKRNALTPDMLHAATALVQGASTRARALVLSGVGSVFCSGFDLSLCLQHPDGRVMRDLLESLSNLIRTLRSLPCPVVVAAHGGALAGGCAILGGADVVITDEHAKLGYPVVRIGVSPAVSAPFLTGMVHAGPARARLLDPGLITGVEAVSKGLAHVCLPTPDQVLPAALHLASDLAAKPAGAMAATKRWLLEMDQPADLAGEALEASLALTGGAEERELLPRALTPPTRR